MDGINFQNFISDYLYVSYDKSSSSYNSLKDSFLDAGGTEHQFDEFIFDFDKFMESQNSVDSSAEIKRLTEMLSEVVSKTRADRQQKEATELRSVNARLQQDFDRYAFNKKEETK